MVFSVIPKIWLLLESNIFSSNLFKISIFYHRNLDNVLSALDYKAISQLSQRKLSQKVSCTYLGFIRSSFFALWHGLSIIYFPSYWSFLSSSFGPLPLGITEWLRLVVVIKVNLVVKWTDPECTIYVWQT